MDFITQWLFFFGYMIFEFSNIILVVLVISLFIANHNRKSQLIYVAENHGKHINRLRIALDEQWAVHQERQNTLWDRITALEEKISNQ